MATGKQSSTGSVAAGLGALAAMVALLLIGRHQGMPFNWAELWPVIWGGRLLVLALVGGAGFLLGALLSPKLKGVRRAIWIAVAIAIVAAHVFGPPYVSTPAGWLVQPLLFLFAFGIGIRLGVEAAKAARRERRQRPTSFGSAKWATCDYLERQGLFSGEGFFLGSFTETPAEALERAERDKIEPRDLRLRRQTLRYEGARHLLTVAPTRSGKGVSSIIPNLLLHEGSALVVDPKGENALITARRRGAGDRTRDINGLGQKIVLLDPWDVAATELGLKPSSFNPLDWIKAGDPDAAENAFLLADAIVVENPGARDSFWDEEAKALLTGLILYVATAAEEEGKRHLGRVRDLLTLDVKKFEEALRLMFKHPDPIVRSTAARTAGKEEKLLSSVMASAQAHTHFLESPRIRRSLERSDFAFEDLKTEALTVYLILPADRLHTFNRWLRLLIQQAITVNARNIAMKPRQPILFLLDEMPTLGKLPSLEQAYGLMAGFGMQLWGIVQDLSQLAKIYGEHGWQTFISNSGVIQYFGSRDKMTAEYFSSLCGVTTVEVRNFSWAVSQAIGMVSGSSTTAAGLQGGSTSSSSSTSVTNTWTRTTGVNESQRQLAYPDELMVLKGGDQIIFVENLDPIAAQKVRWFDDAAMRASGVSLAKAETNSTQAPGAQHVDPSFQ